MYAFFRLDDATRFRSSLDVAKRLVLEAGLGLAPSNAHGQPGPDAQGLAALVFRQSGHRSLGWGVEHAPLAGYNPRLSGVGFLCLTITLGSTRRKRSFCPMSGPLLHRCRTFGAGKKTMIAKSIKADIVQSTRRRLATRAAPEVQVC
jgi:hypothetical protein